MDALYYHLTVGAQGQVKWARWPKSPPFMTSLTKNPHQPTKTFFQVQATRLVAFFETLTRSVAYTRPEKFPCKATCISVFFSQKSPKSAGCESVNTTVRQITKMSQQKLTEMSQPEKTVSEKQC